MPDPTYRRIGDHTECFQVDFDPEVISYEDLLQTYWASQDPTRRSYSTQYASLVLTHNDRQLAAARDSAARLAEVLGREVTTSIEPLHRFYIAEDYHQKYRLRNDPPIFDEFRAMYPDDHDIVDSTAAARVNGYLDGSGTKARLEKEIDVLGLSESASVRLVQAVSGRRFW